VPAAEREREEKKRDGAAIEKGATPRGFDRRFGIELVHRGLALDDEKLVAKSDHLSVELGSAPEETLGAPRRAKRASGTIKTTLTRPAGKIQ